MEKSLPDRAIEWRADQLILLDQRELPAKVEFLSIDSVQGVHDAIKDMVVRGAPAIGITAAYGVLLSAMQHQQLNAEQAQSALAQDIQLLASARPTAVNLSWALMRMQDCLKKNKQASVDDRLKALQLEAHSIHQEDIAANKKMGALGADYISQQACVMTHCNAGALATGGYGTALGVIRAAHATGKIETVLANETRPWFQGARLTAWELQQDAIPVKLLCDSAAASAMAAHDVEWVIVGADRVAANGDVANKIGTYSLAVLAKHAGKRFMVVAPTSTIDLQSASGNDIIIEERDHQEVTQVGGTAMAAEGVSVWNPVFDITPAALIDVLVTERGVVERPDQGSIAQLFAKSGAT